RAAGGVAEEADGGDRGACRQEQVRERIAGAPRVAARRDAAAQEEHPVTNGRDRDHEQRAPEPRRLGDEVAREVRRGAALVARHARLRPRGAIAEVDQLPRRLFVICCHLPAALGRARRELTMQMIARDGAAPQPPRCYSAARALTSAGRSRPRSLRRPGRSFHAAERACHRMRAVGDRTATALRVRRAERRRLEPAARRRAVVRRRHAADLHAARRRDGRAHGPTAAPSRLPVFRLEYGHVYVNASLVAEVMQELPALVVSEGLLRLLPDRLRAEVRRNARSTLSPHVLSTVVHLALRERGWMPWSRAAVFREEAARVARELEKPVDASALPPADLAARIAALQARLGGYLDVVSWAMIYAYVFFHLTAEMVARWGDGEADISQLVAGADGIRTFEIHAELRACARLAERDPALRTRSSAAVPGASPKRASPAIWASSAPGCARCSSGTAIGCSRATSRRRPGASARPRSSRAFAAS